MVRRSAVLSGPATLVFVAALCLVCVLTLRGTYVLHQSEHAVELHLNGDLPPWPRGQHRYGSGSDGGGGSGTARLAGEVWAGFAPPRLIEQRSDVLNLLNADERKKLESLCGRCLLHQLKLFAPQANGHKASAIVQPWCRV